MRRKAVYPKVKEIYATKFMQTLDTRAYKTVATLANRRRITVQELVRAVIVPEWLAVYRKTDKPPEPIQEPVHAEGHAVEQ